MKRKYYKILFVEDDEEDIILLKEIVDKIEDVTFDIHVESSLTDSLNKLKTEEFDVIISDLGLPDSQGMETIKELVSHKQQIPVIVMTGLNDDEVGNEAIRQGAQDYLLKGVFSGEQLFQSIRYAIRRKQFEKDKREQEEKYRLLFENMREGFTLHKIITDENNKPIDYIFIDVNPEFERLTGLQAEKILGKTVLEVLPETEDYWIEKYEKVALKGGSINFQAYAKMFNKYFDITAFSYKENYFATSFNDITNQKEAELELKKLNEELDAQNKQLKKINKELEEAKIKLEDSRLLLSTIINVTPDLVWLKDENGVYLNCNRRFEDFFGKSESEIVGKTDYNFVSKELADFFRENDKNAINAGKPVVNEEEITFALDGHVEILETIKTPLVDKNNNIIGVLGVGRDITERKKVEIDLKRAIEKEEENKKLFFDLFDNLNSGVAIYDIVDNGKDFIFKNFNKAGERIDKQKKENLIGKSIFEVRTGILKSGIVDAFREVVKTKKPVHLPVNFYKDNVLDGFYENYIFLLPTGELVAVFDDITEQEKHKEELKLAKEKVEISEEQHRFLFENMSQGVVYHDITGRIIYANEAASAILGITLDQLYGKTSIDPRWKTIHEDGSNYPGDTHPVAITLKTKEPVMNSKMGVFIPDKNDYNWININSIPRFDKKNGELYQVVVTFEDITDLKNITLDLRKAKQRAEESDRLKSSFLANMSHEIRTPLNGILGFTQLLKSKDIDKEKQEKYLEVIINSSEQLTGIIEDILNISKIETGQIEFYKEYFNIRNLLEVIYDFYDVKSNNTEIQFRCNFDLPVNKSNIFTDKQKVQQIFNILIDNAFKFTQKGFIEFGCEETNGEIKFYVKDSGIGIEKEHHNKIFDRFRQVEMDMSRQYGGTGIGLSIAKGYVNLLGGNIWVESEKEKGSVFYFTIPTEEELPMGNTMQHSTSDEIGEEYKLDKKFKVLIVDDEPINIEYFKEVINLIGISDILTAQDGFEALNKFENNPDIDLILMDIKMPEMDGLIVTKKIKQKNPNIPIIALTALAFSNDRKNALEAGCDFYISKPVDQHELIKVIHRYLSN